MQPPNSTTAYRELLQRRPADLRLCCYDSAHVPPRVDIYGRQQHHARVMITPCPLPTLSFLLLHPVDLAAAQLRRRSVE